MGLPKYLSNRWIVLAPAWPALAVVGSPRDHHGTPVGTGLISHRNDSGDAQVFCTRLPTAAIEKQSRTGQSGERTNQTDGATMPPLPRSGGGLGRGVYDAHAPPPCPPPLRGRGGVVAEPVLNRLHPIALQSRTQLANTEKETAGHPPGQVAAATVRGWWRPMTNTQTVPIAATAAIGIKASGKLPVSAWIQPMR